MNHLEKALQKRAEKKIGALPDDWALPYAHCIDSVIASARSAGASEDELNKLLMLRKTVVNSQGTWGTYARQHLIQREVERSASNLVNAVSEVVDLSEALGDESE